MSNFIKINSKLDLIFERTVNVKPEDLWRGWTEPELLKKWFCPLPWKVIACEIDLRPGGAFNTTMQSPEGENFSNIGSYLTVEKNRKLVWTNALLPDFRPAPKPTVLAAFHFSAHLHFEPIKDGTKYTAICLHSNEEDQKKHAAMGFQEGWGIALNQLLDLIKTFK